MDDPLRDPPPSPSVWLAPTDAFWRSLLGRPVQILQVDDQNKADLASTQVDPFLSADAGDFDAPSALERHADAVAPQQQPSLIGGDRGDFARVERAVQRGGKFGKPVEELIDRKRIEARGDFQSGGGRHGRGPGGKLEVRRERRESRVGLKC